MRNCRHFPLSLQFLYYSLSDLPNRTHLNRTVCHTRKKFAESNKQRQNPISRKAFPSAIDFIRMRFADYRYNRKSRLLRCCFSMHSAPAEGVISHRNATGQLRRPDRQSQPAGLFRIQPHSRTRRT